MDSSNQYAPPRSNVVDVTDADTEVVKANRGTRLGAALLDGLLWTIWFMPLWVRAGMALASHRGAAPTAADFWRASFTGGGVWLVVGALGVLAIAAINIVLVQRNSQSIAKKWLSIKVVRTDGSRATLGRIFWLRNVVPGLFGLIPGLGRFWGLIDPLAIFAEPRRCIHDYIADTIVVRA